MNRLNFVPAMFLILAFTTIPEASLFTQKTGDHSTRFKQYKSLRNLRDAEPASLGPASEPIRIVLAPPQGTLDPFAEGQPSIALLTKYACAADTVVAGSPRAARAAFTAEGTFIFTDFVFDVETSLRGDSGTLSTQVRLIWPGGSLVHNGRAITTTDASYRLPVIGRKYLLFLRQIVMGEFETTEETAGFDITEADAKSLGRGPLREKVKSRSLVELAQAAASGCSK
jgi:hypothetical protein